MREQASTWESIRPSCDDEALLTEAESDVSAGRMLGPFFSLEEIGQALGTQRFVIQRRFPVEQEDTTRPCDDYKSSHANEATYMSRRLRLSLLDSFFALCLLVASLFPSQPPLFSKRDHASAYRHDPLLWSECIFGVVAFWNPILERRCAFIHLVLPFGPTASVVNYDRLADHVLYSM